MNSLDEKIQEAEQTLYLVLVEQLKLKVSELVIPTQNYHSQFEEWQNLNRDINEISFIVNKVQKIWTS